MKARIFILLQVVAGALLAQSPKLINYQGIARDGSGSPVTNRTIGIRFGLRQAAAVVFSEEQTVTTSSLGLFTTQIGREPLSDLSTLNWEAGDITLQVGIDVDGGKNYTDLGTQSLSSVPFAMHASSVPSSYTGGTLTIGTKSYLLSQGSFTNGSGIGITSGSIITNTSPDQTVTLSNGTNINVTGLYPNFTISNTPTLDITGNNLSISGGNTVTLPGATTMSLVGSGAANVNTLTQNSYSLDVPLTGITQTAGIGTITAIGTNSYNVNIPAPVYNQVSGELTTGTVITNITPSLTLANNVLRSGPASNTVPINSYTSGTGISMTGGPSYTISSTAQSTSITPGANNNISVTGTAPSYTVSAPGYSLSAPSASAIQITNGVSTSSTGIATYTAGTGVTMTGGPNYTINSTVQGTSITPGANNNISVTGTAPSYTVSAPGYSLSAPSASAIQISNGVSTSSTGIATYTAGTGVTMSGGPNYTINSTVQGTSITPGANNNISVTGTAPSYTVSAPGYSLSAPSASAIQITNGVSTSSTSIATYTAGTGLSLTGASPNLTISANTTGTNAIWTTLGNAGTNTLTNFIGTTDNVPLNFRVNNQKAGSIDHQQLNVLLGYQTGTAITTGSSNVAVGHQALASLTTGERNTAIGYQTLFNNTTGIINDAVGYKALYNNTSGGSNVAFGYFALTSNTVGGGNVAVGREALYMNSTGDSNTGVGLSSLMLNSIGTENTGFGKYTLFNNSTGFHNTAVGANALYNNTTGNNNTIVGYDADVATGNLTNVTAIGYNSKVRTSNSLVLGDTTNVNVGIGTGSPTKKLDVRGQVRIVDGTQGAGKVLTSDASGNASWQASAASVWGLSGNAGTTPGTDFIGTSDNQDLIVKTNNTEKVRVLASGYVGLGTNSPAALLDVNGNARFSGGKLFIGAVGGINSGYSGLYESSGDIVFAVFKGGAGATAFAPGGNSSDAVVIKSTTGNVGIGTLAPSQKLEVVGTVKIVDGTQGASKILTSDAFGNASWQAPAGGGWATTGNSGTTPGTNFIGTTDNQDLAVRTNSIERMRLLSNGNFGYGTLTPVSPFHITSAVSGAPTLRVENTAGGFSAFFPGGVGIGVGAGLPGGNLSVGGRVSIGTSYYSAPSPANGLLVEGSTGIGTTAPIAKLDVEGDGSIVGGMRIRGIVPNSVGAALYFDAISEDWTIFGSNANSSSGGDKLVFRSYSQAADRMVIDVAGRVGIGLTNPTATLHVLGTMRIEDGTQANGKVLTSDANGNASWQTASSGGWGLTGNAGTTPGTDFIGTSDNKDLVFKTSNVENMRIAATGGISYGSATSSTVFPKLSGVATMTSGGYTEYTQINFNPGSSQFGGVSAAGYFINQSGLNTGGGTQFNTALTGYLNLSGTNSYAGEWNTSAWLHTFISGGTHQRALGVMGTLEGSGNLTDAYGGYFGSIGYTGSATNFYAVYAGATSGTNRWGIYSEDAGANNYFAGKTGIGVAAPTASLEVNGTVKITDGTQAAGKVLTSDASGNASWQAAGTPSSSICFLKDIKTSGTNAGASIANTWITRDLNTVEGNTSMVNLSGSQFTLQPGTYIIRSEVPALMAGHHQAKLYNATDNADVIYGRSAFCYSPYLAENVSIVEGMFTIATAKAFQIQQIFSTAQPLDGLGFAGSFGPEVYTQVQITKVN
jgi:hypothetical protein